MTTKYLYICNYAFVLNKSNVGVVGTLELRY